MSSKNLTLTLLVLIVLAVLWTNGRLQRIIYALTGDYPASKAVIAGKAETVKTK